MRHQGELTMRDLVVRKRALHEPDTSADLQDKTPQELVGMMWRLALDAWSFKGRIDAEPRLQRHIVVLKRGSG